MKVTENLEKIQAEINHHLEKSVIKTAPNVIAVTKYVTIDRAKEAYDAGLRHFGENRVEGFLEKKQALPKDVINDIDYLHALDRLSLAKEINKRATHTISCFIQVNVSGEETKHGIALSEVNDFIEQIKAFDNIKIVGLMTMAPYTDDKDYIHQLFKQLRLKRDEIKNLKLNYAPCEYLSMGMSNDYTIAVEEGATFIRIGTKLVGEEE